MGKPSEGTIAETLERIVAAALAGDRCPGNRPDGPLHRESCKLLVERGMIRLEVYPHNWRQAHVLAGEHKGLATAPDPLGKKPYLVNGDRVGRKTAPLSAVQPEMDVRPSRGHAADRHLTASLTVPKGRRIVSIAPLPPQRVAAFSFGDPSPERSELARRLAEQSSPTASVNRVKSERAGSGHE